MFCCGLGLSVRDKWESLMKTQLSKITRTVGLLSDIFVGLSKSARNCSLPDTSDSMICCDFSNRPGRWK